MLFHVTHTHRAENCSAHKPERQAAFRQVMAGAGDKLKGVYANALAHTTYILVEADDAMELARMFDPILEYGHYEINPVVQAGALLDELGEENG